MSPPVTIDYTDKDYASLRRALLELARYRLPEWTDRSPADLGVLLVDMFAYLGDVVLYYQDRIANESFVQTAVERRSILHLLRLVGYELAPAVSAVADLQLTFNVQRLVGPFFVTIASGSRFRATAPTHNPRIFEYLGPDLTIDIMSDQVAPGASGTAIYTGLPVRQCEAVPTEILGSSTGEPNQTFKLGQVGALLDTLVLEVQEGSHWVQWDRRDSFIYNTDESGRVSVSSPDARDYTAQIDEHGAVTIVFGDGSYGRRPPVGLNNLRATYRVGGGAAGNVAAGTITQTVTPISRLVSVTNLNAASGGADAETTEHARRWGPMTYRSSYRAVTLEDHVALAFRAGGVAKVRARSVGWNRIELYVAPEGERCSPVPEELRRHLIAWFEERRMAGTTIDIFDARGVEIDLTMSVIADPRYRNDNVRQSVEDAVRAWLSFSNVDFEMSMYLSDLYAAVEAVPGVSSVTVTRFRRADGPNLDIDAELAKYNLPQLSALPAFLQRAVRIDVEPEGRATIGPYEIPMLGALSVSVTGARA